MFGRGVMLAALAASISAASCSETVELGNGGTGASCVPGGPQCNDCEDNDNDGLIDGFDPECTGARDDDEASFATGIPGDNTNSVRQDCFFDGNSGAGNDGCDLHVCCILDLMGGECPPEFQPQSFDPGQCDVTPECVENCAPLAPAGCDCFGCCTVCADGLCADILINPAVSPDCRSEDLGDPALCARCIKNDQCGAGCEDDSCILCPGQTIEDLPPSCEQTCPNGGSVCGPSAPCQEREFCSNGCCVGIPE